MASIPSTKAKEQETASVILHGAPKKQRTKKNFTIISNEILRDPNLTTGAKLALITLISYCWFDKDQCFPGQETLAATVHKSTRTIRRYLTELQEKGYIKIRHRGLGRPNHYTITLPYGTKMPAQEWSTVAGPDRTKMTAESDEPKHTQLESDEALSNSSKGTDEIIPACSHIASATNGIRNGETEEKPALSNRNTDTIQHTNPSTPNRAETTNIETQKPEERPRRRLLATGMTSTAEIMGKAGGAVRQQEPPRMTAPPFTQEDMDKRIRERLARERAKQENPLDEIIPPEHLQTLNRQFGTGMQQTACKSKRQPVYEKLQVAIERISEELGDFKHVTANITQAENIRRAAHADFEQFIVMLYEARAATKHALTMGKITKQDSSNGQLVKMPYFYAVLREKAGISKAQRMI